MTTNKPEIVAYMRPAYGEVISQEEYARWEHEATRNPGTPYGEWRKNETIEYSEPLIRLSDYEALQDECNALRAKTSMSIGVGDGTGNLFVHGDYDSIKRVQELIFECEELIKVADKYHRLIELSKFLEKEEWNDAFAQGFNAGFNSDERPAQDVAALLRERAVMVDKIEALETKCWKLAGVLELISVTDPDKGTAWFHEIAHKALEAHQQEK